MSKTPEIRVLFHIGHYISLLIHFPGPKFSGHPKSKMLLLLLHMQFNKVLKVYLSVISDYD